jgi:hypothetical protein
MPDWLRDPWKCPSSLRELEWESSAGIKANAEQDLEADSVATNLSGLKGPVAQGLGHD